MKSKFIKMLCCLSLVTVCSSAVAFAEGNETVEDPNAGIMLINEVEGAVTDPSENANDGIMLINDDAGVEDFTSGDLTQDYTITVYEDGSIDANMLRFTFVELSGEDGNHTAIFEENSTKFKFNISVSEETYNSFEVKDIYNFNDLRSIAKNESEIDDNVKSLSDYLNVSEHAKDGESVVEENESEKPEDNYYKNAMVVGGVITATLAGFLAFKFIKKK